MHADPSQITFVGMPYADIGLHRMTTARTRANAYASGGAAGKSTGTFVVE